jgi:putative aminopeptidase FrvX
VKKSLDFLKQLLYAPMPSGFEQPVQKVWRKYTPQYAEKVDYDLEDVKNTIILLIQFTKRLAMELDIRL